MALHQAKIQQQWPPTYDQYWQQLISQKDKNQANKDMVDFLWWARDFELTQVTDVLEACLQCGCHQLEAIKLLMRQQQEVPYAAQLEVSALGQLVQYERPMSTVNHYDQLLSGGI